MRTELGVSPASAVMPATRTRSDGVLAVAGRYVWRQRYLYLMLVPALVYYVVFHYVPLYGASIAFKDFNIGRGITGSAWAGTKHFDYLFGLDKFWDVFRNTLIISTYRLILGFPFPIFVALLLNEVRREAFKRFVQTAIYLPHFISWVILGGILQNLLAPDGGIVNETIQAVGGSSVSFLGDESWFRSTLVVSMVWKEFGWNTIIYLAAMAGINPQLYEAAMVDGANRWQQMRHVTLAGIRGAIVILLILRLGFMMEAGFEQIFVLYSPRVYRVADILDTYVYRIGLLDGQFSRAAAVGLFKSVINFGLLLAADRVIRRIGGREHGIFG
jgi:putative aldouronate transport system permease protein